MSEITGFLSGEPHLVGVLSVGNVKAEPTLQSKTVTPTTSEQVVSYDIPTYEGLSDVVIYGVDSSIDSNIKAENIKKDVEILGIVGTSAPILQNKTVEPSVNSQVVECDSTFDALGQVEVQGVTFSIDSNIQPVNIVKDVTILGVKGTAIVSAPLEIVDAGYLCSFDIKRMEFMQYITTKTTNLSSCFYQSPTEEVIFTPGSVVSVQQFASCFYNCTNIKRVENLNFNSVFFSPSNIFYKCINLEILLFEENSTLGRSNVTFTLDMSPCIAYTEQALLTTLSTLANNTTDRVKTFKLATSLYDSLQESTFTIFTSRGYTLAK